MKNIELCEHCIYGRIIKKDNVILGRTYELPLSVFLSKPHDKNEPDNECSDFIKSDVDKIHEIKFVSK